MGRILYTALALVVVIGIFATAGTADAATRVKGHVRKSTGTYVAPHHRSSPDHTKVNNWSTKGNHNPYTGKKGTKKR